MADAPNPKLDRMRQIFKGPNFTGGMRPARKGLPTEAQLREEEPISPEELIEDCKKGATSLALIFCKLEKVPEEVLSLTHLTELDLYHNNLESLPDDIGVLSHLRVFKVCENRLTSIPASLCMCEDLRVLALGNNLLADLPIEFTDLPALEELGLNYNYFTEIPLCATSSMLTLKTLEIIENSGITALPDASKWAGPRKLTLALDNSPELSASWDAVKPQLEAKGCQIAMRWNKIFPDMVQDRMFLGSLRTVQDKSVFDHLKITHVLTCGSNLSSKMKLPPGIKHLVLEMDDSQKEPIARHFDRANDFLDSALRDPNGGIVVHCFAGVSRSATVVVAYLMRNGMTFEQAMETVKTARAAANPNPNFINQLIQYEKSLQGSGASSGKSA